MEYYITSKRTKFIIAVLALFIVLSTVMASAQKIEVDSTYKEPQIFIKNTDLPTVMIGEVFELNLTLLNESIYTARDAYIIPKFAEDTPFESVELINRVKLNRILAGKETDVS